MASCRISLKISTNVSSSELEEEKFEHFVNNEKIAKSNV